MKLMIGITVLCAFLAPPALAQTPDGTGDPLAVSCRPPQPLSGSRLIGPKVCKTNAAWAQYRRDGMDVAADGLHDVPTEKWRSINPQYCYRGPVNSGSTTNAMRTSFSPVCF